MDIKEVIEMHNKGVREYLLSPEELTLRESNGTVVNYSSLEEIVNLTKKEMAKKGVSSGIPQ